MKNDTDAGAQRRAVKYAVSTALILQGSGRQGTGLGHIYNLYTYLHVCACRRLTSVSHVQRFSTDFQETIFFFSSRICALYYNGNVCLHRIIRSHIVIKCVFSNILKTIRMQKLIITSR